MAQQPPIRVRAQHPRGSEGRAVRQEQNRLVRKVRAICEMLDADAGVAGTGYLALFDAADGPREVHVGTDPNE